MALPSASAELKLCPGCASTAMLMQIGPARFPFKVGCIATACGLQTPWTKLEAIAIEIWNRRVERKPPKRAIRRRTKARKVAPGD